MMTLDEAIINMENQADLLKESAAGCDLCDSVEKEIAYRSGKRAEEYRQLTEWLKDYKKLKVQEPYSWNQQNGAISRADMLDAIGHGTTYTSEDLQRIIKALPPVNPQPKIGHWIQVDSDKCKWIKYDYRTICPKECGGENPYWRIPENANDLKYCPYCGREIEIESQESESGE